MELCSEGGPGLDGGDPSGGPRGASTFAGSIVRRFCTAGRCDSPGEEGGCVGGGLSTAIGCTEGGGPIGLCTAALEKLTPYQKFKSEEYCTLR